ncbi:MAG: DNA repair protein RadC [Betaproteobacteria bacterium]
MTHDQIIKRALTILGARIRRSDVLSSPHAVRDYLRLLLAGKQHEVFVCVHLDSQNRVIACEELFRGTLTHTAVHPREVVKAALAHNAAAMIFCHNHPGGVCRPSLSDEMLTATLSKARALIEVRVLDHFIVSASGALSFAENGMLGRYAAY